MDFYVFKYPINVPKIFHNMYAKLYIYIYLRIETIITFISEITDET